jgi:hypothetical protein
MAHLPVSCDLKDFPDRGGQQGAMPPNAPVQRRAAQRTVRCNRLLAGISCLSE